MAQTKRKQRAPARVGARDEPGAEVVIDGRCGCGAEVRVVVAGSAPAWVRSIAERQQSSEAMECAACVAERERVEVEQEARERADEALAQRRGRSGVPPKWMGQAFDALDDDEERRRALLRAGEWAAGEVRGLVLWGPVGRGKTAIAAAAAELRMRRGGAVRWLSVADLLMDLRMPFDSREYARAQRTLDAARGRFGLVLDDLDKIKPSEFAVEPLYVAINGWIEADLPLLVTLNRDLDAIEAWLPDSFGPAIASRLSGYCKVQHVGGRDRRIEP